MATDRGVMILDLSSFHYQDLCSFINFSESPKQSTMSLEDAEKAIPATVRMFSGCEDVQTSADGEFEIKWLSQ